MELVVGASEATMKSVMGKLGGLLAKEYTLIRGVNGDLQYINDELASMQSFLRDLATITAGNGQAQSHGHRMKDWMNQIRDITYDIEDCIDNSAHRLHGLRSDMYCYFFVNSVYEVLTWWPRRDVASKISVLKMRAQQIGERRERYGVNNPDQNGGNGSATHNSSTAVAGFDAAGNQYASLQLVTTEDPVGVDEHMGELHKWVTCIVGFGGVGKTAIANALYKKFGDQFDHRAVVTVSQSSDVEAILSSIKSQVKPEISNHEQQRSTEKNRLVAAIKGVRRETSAVMAKCFRAGTSGDTRPATKLDQLKKEIRERLQQKRYLVLIDDVWSATTLEQIINSLPKSNDSRIIVTTRFHAVATTRIVDERDIRKVKGLVDTESKKLFSQALLESKGSKEVTAHPQGPTTPSETGEDLSKQVVSENVGSHDATTQTRAPATITKGKDGIHSQNVGTLCGDKPADLSNQTVSKSVVSKEFTVPDVVWKICGGLPLAIVTMAGNVACNPNKTQEEWMDLCSSLFTELAKKGGRELTLEEWMDICSSLLTELAKKDGRELTQEELGRIVSYCYNDMPSEIKTCSLYLSIFPKGHKISRKRLTRRWIAEGFVCEKQGLSVEDVAETYFNHLIRRKIIRAVEHSSNGKVKSCVVHDMVLEHIVTKASEENFITVVGGNWLIQPPSSKVRRLSLQESDSKRANDTEKMNLSRVRSLTMFGSLKQLPSHSFKFGIVQVLDLEGCTGFTVHHTKEICKMLLLKYLSLRRTDTKKIPKSIGKLENLETLDIRQTDVVELPKTLCLLERLVNVLGGDKRTRRALRLPEELNKKKKMKALRILSGIEIVGGLADLHHLTELRKLVIYKLSAMGDDANFKDLSSSIEYLGGYALHTLIIDDELSKFIKSLDDMSSPPKFLVALELSGKIIQLPTWIRQLSALSKLTISVTALRTDNLLLLSNLEALFSLTFSFRAEKQDSETMTILAENKLSSDGEITFLGVGFQSLKLLRFCAPLLPVLSFSKNAMPKLERLELRFSMLEGLCGVEYLAGLKVVHLTLDDKDGEHMANMVQLEVEGAVKRSDGKAPKIILDQ